MGPLFMAQPVNHKSYIMLDTVHHQGIRLSLGHLKPHPWRKVFMLKQMRSHYTGAENDWHCNMQYNLQTQLF